MYRRFAVALVAALATLTACGTNSPMAASDSFAPAAKTTGGVVVPTPTRQFMFVWGSISINGVPAPAGTVVSALDRAGHMAGQFTVWYPGYYGAMAVYLDDPETSLDEGATLGEWLYVRVNGQSSRSKFQWTRFGDVVRVDVVTTSTAPKSGPPPTAKSGSAAMGKK
mgnify:CR=1 FL=1